MQRSLRANFTLNVLKNNCLNPAARKIVAPCYHLVADGRRSHVQNLYPFRNPAEFERELDWLLARFQPVGLEQVEGSITQAAPLPPRPLFLSFDDGFREMAEVVAPICKRKGVPVTFFLTTDFLDNRQLGFRHKASVLLERLATLSPEKALAIVQEAARTRQMECGQDVRKFILAISHAQAPVLDEAARLAGFDFADYLQQERPYLNSAQVHALLKDGFSIGAHSRDHPRYSEISAGEQLAQTQGSVEFLEQNFGMKHRAFAFPFVADGVGNEFYRHVFSQRLCDLVFCIGALPSNGSWPVVERFGVEQETNEPIWTILRDQSRRRLRARVSRWLAPLRQLVK